MEPFTFERNGHTVHLIDTPGFDGSTTSDALLLEDIAACLNQAYTYGVQVSGIIYLNAINSPRAQGSAKKALRIVKKICGELHIEPGDNGRGTRFRITFVSVDPKNRSA